MLSYILEDMYYMYPKLHKYKFMFKCKIQLSHPWIPLSVELEWDPWIMGADSRRSVLLPAMEPSYELRFSSVVHRFMEPLRLLDIERKFLEELLKPISQCTCCGCRPG